MINPASSPWNKPRQTYIADRQLYSKWLSIKKYLTTNPVINEFTGVLRVDDSLFIAKNKTKFRLKSHLDWAYYTPKTLAQAIDNNTIEEYYEIMLNDIRSDPNIWKDTDFEMTLKSFYAARVGRAEII